MSLSIDCSSVNINNFLIPISPNAALRFGETEGPIRIIPTYFFLYDFFLEKPVDCLIFLDELWLIIGTSGFSSHVLSGKLCKILKI